MNSTRIEDKNGLVLFEVVPETTDVLSEEVAYVSLNLMQGVTQHGSGARLRHSGFDKDNRIYKQVVTGYPFSFENAIAGKTGTTQNQSDGWFMGMVPNLATGVWVGGEDRSIHFKNIGYGQGATMALPVWANYMKGLYNRPELGVSQDPFTEPEEISIRLDCESIEQQQLLNTDMQEEDLDSFGF